MAVRKFISKGKGRNKRSFPIKPKRGVSVRSVSLQPQAIGIINNKQIKLLKQGKPATFSKALNQVVLRKKKNIPVYDTHVNLNERRKPFIMHVTDMKKHKKVKGSETIVMAEHYGQAVDDFITVWNKDPNRMKMQIGYPVVQGTAMKKFRYKKDTTRLVDTIKHGDKVTIITQHGSQITGRAIMKSSAGDNSWVLNTGGAHGTPALAFDDNVVKVVEGR